LRNVADWGIFLEKKNSPVSKNYAILTTILAESLDFVRPAVFLFKIPFCAALSSKL
jgi:hypothetical protein